MSQLKPSHSYMMGTNTGPTYILAGQKGGIGLGCKVAGIRTPMGFVLIAVRLRAAPLPSKTQELTIDEAFPGISWEIKDAGNRNRTHLQYQAPYDISKSATEQFLTAANTFADYIAAAAGIEIDKQAVVDHLMAQLSPAVATLDKTAEKLGAYTTGVVNCADMRASMAEAINEATQQPHFKVIKGGKYYDHDDSHEDHSDLDNLNKVDAVEEAEAASVDFGNDPKPEQAVNEETIG